MILLVLTNPSIDYAKYISSMIWSVGRPEQTRGSVYVTAFYCNWIQHPENGQVALEMPNDDEYIHPDCDADAIANALPIPETDKAQLKTDINTAKGTRVQPAGLVPASLVGNILTMQEAKDSGWYPSEEIE